MSIEKSSLKHFFFRFLFLILVIQPNNTTDFDNSNTDLVGSRVHRFRRAWKVHAPSCSVNQYFDEEEGRCMGVPGGGKALHVSTTISCGTNVLKPHCTNSKYYYICKRNKTILAQCSELQRFENRLQKCVRANPRDLNATTVQSDVETFHRGQTPVCKKLGKFPIPGHCDLFYTCETNGHHMFQTVFKCPENTGYLMEKETCGSLPGCENSKSNGPSNCMPIMDEKGIQPTDQPEVIEKLEESVTTERSVHATTSDFETTTKVRTNEKFTMENNDDSSVTVTTPEILLEETMSSNPTDPSPAISSTTIMDEYTTVSNNNALRESAMNGEAGTTESTELLTTSITEDPILSKRDNVIAPEDHASRTTEDSVYYDDTTMPTSEIGTTDPTSMISSTDSIISTTERTTENLNSEDTASTVSVYSSTADEESTFSNIPTTTDSLLRSIQVTSLSTNELLTTSETEDNSTNFASTQSALELTATTDSPDTLDTDSTTNNSTFASDSDKADNSFEQTTDESEGTTFAVSSLLVSLTEADEVETSATTTESSILTRDASTEFTPSSTLTDEFSVDKDVQVSTESQPAANVQFDEPEPSHVDSIASTIKVDSTTTDATNDNHAGASDIEKSNVTTNPKFDNSKKTCDTTGCKDSTDNIPVEPTPYSRNSKSNETGALLSGTSVPGTDSSMTQRNLTSSDIQTVTPVTGNRRGLNHAAGTTSEGNEGAAEKQSVTTQKAIYLGRAVSTRIGLPIASAVINITDKLERRARNIINRIMRGRSFNYTSNR